RGRRYSPAKLLGTPLAPEFVTQRRMMLQKLRASYSGRLAGCDGVCAVAPAGIKRVGIGTELSNRRIRGLAIRIDHQNGVYADSAVESRRKIRSCVNVD